MPIALKFTFALLTCIACGVVAQAYFAARAEIARSERENGALQLVTARAVRAPIANVWATEGPDRALSLVRESDQHLPEVDIRWVSLAPEATIRPKLPLARLDAAVRGEAVIIIDREFEGVGRIFSYAPFTPPGGKPAAIEVSRALGDAGCVKRSAIRRAALTAAGTALASGVITTLLGVMIVGRPLRRLVQQARRVGEGDLSYRIAADGRDEIGALAQEMNRMCDRLVESHRAMERQHGANVAALERLRHAERLATVGRLAAGIAHEMGTPLAVVAARAKRISHGELPPAEAADKARIIAEQVDRMAKLIRQLLDFARKRPLQRVDTYLGPLAERTTALLEPVAQARGVVLKTARNNGDVRASVDPDQIAQVMTNLVTNAVHASRRGAHVTVAVARTRVTREDSEVDCARIDVRDEGDGIAPENLPRLFEPFFTTKQLGEGTGLGLSIAYAIARDHDGWIDVKSTVGVGTWFSVYVPERVT